MNDKLIMEQKIKEYLEVLSKIQSIHYVTKIKVDEDGSITELNPTPMINMELPGYVQPFLENCLKDIDKETLMFLKAYLIKVKKYEFVQKDFDELYLEYLKGSEENVYVNRTLTLLHGYKLIGGASVEVDGLVIKNLDSESAEYYYNHVYEGKMALSYNINDISSIINPKPTLVIEYKSHCEEEVKTKVRGKILNLGKAIILSNGVINKLGFSPAITYSYFTNIYAKSFFPEFPTVGFKKNVELENIEVIKRIYKKLDKLDPGLKFIPIDRIYSAHNKNDLEDKFIDLMIALEASYPSVKAEVTYRISLYTTKLLNGDKTLFNKVKKLYNLRSDIVHGNKIAKEKMLRSLSELESIVLQVALTGLDYIANNKTLEDMEEDINKKIFG
ncbi:HEPN domain-containing protein [Bacillus sp. PK3_68]|uniref:HEPN domain-containing protein n=1 Tax=Bacillus sp. PK3_68 TaxID=2027408 RepID=UPI000E745578|nr:HEPN domain-containing protein [Bacillus sp. PK3_68]RJS60127.1 hypothetical protein CJ483_08675 [Bacillus sp. PK3_68]